MNWAKTSWTDSFTFKLSKLLFMYNKNFFIFWQYTYHTCIWSIFFRKSDYCRFWSIKAHLLLVMLEELNSRVQENLKNSMTMDMHRKFFIYGTYYTCIWSYFLRKIPLLQIWDYKRQGCGSGCFLGSGSGFGNTVSSGYGFQNLKLGMDRIAGFSNEPDIQLIWYPVHP